MTCGNCGLPLHPNEVRRHFGFYINGHRLFMEQK